MSGRLEDRYPRTLGPDGTGPVVRLMRPEDGPAVLAFARTLPQHDLLFLRRDITHERVLEAWIEGIRAGTLVSLLAFEGDAVVGCTAVVVDPHAWSRHVGELRVLLAPHLRERGVGRALVQECFAVALLLDLAKLCAYMTADQQAAIAVFEDLGFRAEALLRDHVRDRDDVSHDLVILALDVPAAASRMEAYGMLEAD